MARSVPQQTDRERSINQYEALAIREESSARSKSVASLPTPESLVDSSDEDSLQIATTLNHYLPIGCLILERSGINASVCTSPNTKWYEIKQEVPTLVQPALIDSEVTSYETLDASIKALLRAALIRVTCRVSTDASKEIWRVYVLPFDELQRTVTERDKPTLRQACSNVLARLNVSSVVWSGFKPEEACNGNTQFDPWAEREMDDDKNTTSSFFVFNTLQSPRPSPGLIQNNYLRKAVTKLVDKSIPVWGLKTELYPFQRRSAATMIQREVVSQMQLDPRFGPRISPTGQRYYYCGRTQQFIRHARYYDTVRGGILAESMGHGKTLICIAVILTTKGQIPAVPSECLYVQNPPRERVGSLMDMSAAATLRNSVPWGAELERKRGVEHVECVRAIERNFPFYEKPGKLREGNRSATRTTLPTKILRFRGTLVVVPSNLVKQWRSELAKHVVEGFLKVLYMDGAKTKLPSQRELGTYDVVLFSRSRFDTEAGAKRCRRGARDEQYISPLRGVYWLRIIVDEGHAFANSTSKAAGFSSKELLAERRWIVSGTPARDLLGLDAIVVDNGLDIYSTREKMLKDRKLYDYTVERSSGAVSAIGALASGFLHAQPWNAQNTEADGEKAPIWDEYVYRHDPVPGQQEESTKRRTFSCFSWCLRRTLENLFIKTGPEEVNQDMILPPLTHEVVKLAPSPYDKLIANLFILNFVANTVTSERIGIDYLFFHSNRRQLLDLVKNLRLSAFTWHGFSEVDVQKTLQIAEEYLEQTQLGHPNEDCRLLDNTARVASLALELPVWKALTSIGGNSIGMMLENWPEGSQDTWALAQCESPMTMDLGRLLLAQKFVNGRLTLTDPTDGLAGAGIKARGAVVGASRAATVLASSKSARKRKRKVGDKAYVEVAPDSALGQTRLVGTVSAKFSYLISSIVELHEAHKCLIFYDANTTAAFLGEAFELLHIKHLIYTNDIKDMEKRSRYIELFNQDPGQRVLLMDLKQAAHGLHIPSATRIFFVNPSCRPDIEAQAIKRAHRIGQTQPVHVETLILEGTVEEAIYERSSNMTKKEHLEAKVIEDDEGVKTILQNARVFPLTPEELTSHGCMAPLEVPQQIFGRRGRVQQGTALEKEIFGDDGSDVDADAAYANADENEDEADVQPIRRRLAKRRVATIVEDDMEEEMVNTETTGEASDENSTSLFGG